MRSDIMLITCGHEWLEITLVLKPNSVAMIIYVKLARWVSLASMLADNINSQSGWFADKSRSVMSSDPVCFGSRTRIDLTRMN
jgi:hypothetical protein